MQSIAGRTAFVAVAILLALSLASCMGGPGSQSSSSGLPATAVPPVTNPDTQRESARLPAFRPDTVKISEVAVPTTPEYIAEGPDGAVYFGGANDCSGLYRYFKGAFVITAPATNSQYPSPNCGAGVGGVRAVNVSMDNTVAWAAFYPTNDDFNNNNLLNCGGNGGKATFCRGFEGLLDPTPDQHILSIYAQSRSRILGAQDVWLGFPDYITENGVVGSTYGFDRPFTVNSTDIQVIAGQNGILWVLAEACPLSPPDNLPVCNPPFTLLQLNAQGLITKSLPFPKADYIGGIASGHNGVVWFTDVSKSSIGRITSAGQVNLYPLPAGSSLYSQRYTGAGIVSAPDGGIWFTDPGANKIGRIGLRGHITEFSLPTPNAGPGEITAPIGANCNQQALWFAENGHLGEVTYE